MDREAPDEPGTPHYVQFHAVCHVKRAILFHTYVGNDNHIRRVADGAERLERVEFGDGYTNNEAEYDSLIEALEDLIRRIEEAGRRPGEFRVQVRGDSALVINQLQGTWHAHDARMAARRDTARALLDRFAAAELKAHPREESVRVLGH